MLNKLVSSSRLLLLFTVTFLLITSCSVQQQIQKSAQEDVLANTALQAAHVGISIFDPATSKYLYNYQGDKYFVPASNTKIPTCYAAMKYLGDSLVGLRYGIPEEKAFDKYVIIKPTGDPTFLHEHFPSQPVLEFLKDLSLHKYKLGYCFDESKVERWGSGWSWNDYEASYMAERNVFPVFGNILNVRLNDSSSRNAGLQEQLTGKRLKLFITGSNYFDSIINDIPYLQSVSRKQFLAPVQNWRITRSIERNIFGVEKATLPITTFSIPFVTNHSSTTLDFLKDTLKLKFRIAIHIKDDKYDFDEENSDINIITINNWQTIHSQPTDSVLKPMMHRSDNFFAEQLLLMVSNELFGVMNDQKIIDSLLKTDLKDLPQQPRWADGSGLSRYNLFTPQDFVFILNKMKNEFGMERVKEIFPTGGEGTISNYYKKDAGFIYGKTGTLSGVVAFSGFLYTKKGKLLLFSTLVNNHTGSATDVRRAIEKFLMGIRQRY